ncbi:MAG: hypothetical protein ACI8RZ_002891 [Myxococcota bacterium]|jgi:hypothetical protein
MLLLLLGCADAPAPEAPTGWAACPDPICRHEGLAQSWQTEPDAVLATIPTLDPVEQLTLVQFLLTDHPQQQQQICAALPAESPGGKHCARAKARPHLTQSKHRQITTFTPRPGGGPSRNILPPPKSEPAAWLSRDRIDLGDCGKDAECVTERATNTALSGDLNAAGTICRSGASSMEEVYWECLFETAESLSRTKRSAQWSQAVVLCNATESFVHGCLHHTLTLAMPDIPPADGFSTENIEAATQAAADFSAAVGGGELGALYADRMWASWVWQAYFHTETVTGQLVPALPEAAQPHIRLAVAYRMLEDRTDWSTSLADLLAALDSNLARQDPPQSTGKVHRPTSRKRPDFWPEDHAHEDTIPAIYCTGDSRRATDPDARIDAMIAILEAAGRLKSPPPSDFYARVIQDSTAPEVVRWTAARILSARDPAAAASLVVPDATPLIAGRLRHSGR